MPTAVRWIVRVLTFLTLVGMVYLTGLGISLEDARLIVPCALLTLATAYFVYWDVRNTIAGR